MIKAALGLAKSAFGLAKTGGKHIANSLSRKGDIELSKVEGQRDLVSTASQNLLGKISLGLLLFLFVFLCFYYIGFLFYLGFEKTNEIPPEWVELIKTSQAVFYGFLNAFFGWVLPTIAGGGVVGYSALKFIEKRTEPEKLRQQRKREVANAEILDKSRKNQIRNLVIHCSATEAGKPFSAKDIIKWHTGSRAGGGRGWKKPGYHYVIELSGKIVTLVRHNDDGFIDGWEIANGVKGHNRDSIHICYIGGLRNKHPENTLNHDQTASLLSLLNRLVETFPDVRICGHNDLNHNKACPSFRVDQWLEDHYDTAFVNKHGFL